MEKTIGTFALEWLRGIFFVLILFLLLLLTIAVAKLIAKAVTTVARKIPRKPEPASAFPAMRFLYDFELCGDMSELKQTIRTVNDCGYNLICVTQSEDTYTVFFRRFVGG